MAVPLYDLSVATYLQMLDSISAVMVKGAEHANANGIDLQEIVDTRLREDMAPFLFQVVSVAHHSRGAIEGCRAGVFSPPPSLELDYAGLQNLLVEAAQFLRGVSAEEVEAMQGNALTFKVGDFEVPFKVEDFLRTFSLPNFYFHATATYAILRMAGVPLGKMDFLGQMRTAG